MPIAIRTDTSLAPTITQTTFASALITAFANAGFSATTDDYTSGTDRILVYRFDTDASRAKGRNFLRIRITSALAINILIGTDFNISTKAMSDASAEATIFTLATNFTITFIALNCGSEGRFVMLSQSTNFAPLGLLIPVNRPTWWNLDTWSYCYMFTNAAMTTLRSSAINPYSNVDNEILTFSRLSGVNAQTNRRDVLTGLTIGNNSSNGVAGKTSDDIAIAAGNGSARFDVLAFTGSTQQYLLVVNAASGIAFRTQ